MEGTAFKEAADRFSTFIQFNDGKFVVSVSDTPQLSFLRIELERVHPGMSDFVIRVATPKYKEVNTNNVISIRGNRSMAKYDTVTTLAETIAQEFLNKGDKTFKWEALDTEHLADMLINPLKFFAVNTTINQLRFTTEALL